MENLPPYSLHLQSLLASSSAQNEVPRSDAIQALRGHVEALLGSAQRRLVVLRIGKERVEALRVRDAAREKMVATEREREKERERERDRERKEKERKEKERQRREKERDDRERDRQEIQHEARQAQTAAKGGSAAKGAAQPSNKAINRPPTVKVELGQCERLVTASVGRGAGRSVPSTRAHLSPPSRPTGSQTLPTRPSRSHPPANSLVQHPQGRTETSRMTRRSRSPIASQSTTTAGVRFLPRCTTSLEQTRV